MSARDFYTYPFNRNIRHDRSLSKVLIIDDDIDSTIILHDELRKLGCSISYAVGIKDACQQILELVPNVIVLDWELCEKTGSDVVEKAISEISRFSDLQEKFLIRQPKIITYSSHPISKVTLPSTLYFDYVGHWLKRLDHRSLAKRIRYTLI